MRALVPVGLLIFGLGACTPKVTPPPFLPPPPPRPAIRIPAGCAADQSGTYTHAEDRTFRYLARDDGGTLDMVVDRLGRDGGTTEPAEARLRLDRTPRGFVGVTRAKVFTPDGRSCPAAEFPTEVVACEDAGLVLRTAAKVDLDEACRPPPHPTPSVMVEQRLLRQPATPGPDAGVAPDAGSGRDAG